MPQMITQEELRHVQAGQTLYVKFVKDTRHRIQAGARIEDGPLTVDLNALRSEGVPLCIIVPTSALPVESGTPAPPTVPIVKRDIQSFISLLDWTAGPERRRMNLREYWERLGGYRAQMTLVFGSRRRAMRDGISSQQPGQFASQAVALYWTVLRLQTAGLFYAYGMPASVTLNRMLSAAASD